MNATVPEWVTVGAKVRAWSGRTPDPERTIERVTKTQVILDDGSRWRLSTLTPVGSEGTRYWVRNLHSASDPEMLAALAEAKRKNAAWGVDGLGPKWGNNPSEENAQALRDAIKRLAPHLGLTVTDQTTEDPS